jgi:uncharacterized membrane protein
MINQLRKLYSQHKYKVGVFVLLNAASAVCISLVVARILYSDTDRYIVLVWNLFLAWIPFVLAYLVYMLSWRRRLVYFVIPAFAFLWLIFFPNAPYILTDLQHLSKEASDVPLWYDVILLVWFSWTGMLLGIVSLSLMQEIIRREFSRRLGWVFVFVVAGLSSAGVYIGRFIRLNSWDIFRNPAESADNLWSWLSDPSLRSIGFIGLYTIFFIFVYLILYAFGHISHDHEPAPKQPDPTS